MELIVGTIIVIVTAILAALLGYNYGKEAGILKNQEQYRAAILHEGQMRASAEREVKILRHILSIVAPEHVPKQREQKDSGDITYDA